MKKKFKKLSLTTETLTNLTSSNLEGVVGASLLSCPDTLCATAKCSNCTRTCTLCTRGCNCVP